MSSSFIDLIIQIKNGYLAKKESIELPYSILKEHILKKLVSLKYVKSYKTFQDTMKKIRIEFLYEKNEPALTDVKICSTPGKRWYVTKSKIKPVLGGLGKAILSTSKGILTSEEAKKQGVGGELLFEIW